MPRRCWAIIPLIVAIRQMVYVSCGVAPRLMSTRMWLDLHYLKMLAIRSWRTAQIMTGVYTGRWSGYGSSPWVSSG